MSQKCNPKELEKTLLLLDPFEKSIYKDNCVHGQQVEDILESEIRTSMNSSNQELKGSRLAEMLSKNDPFEIVGAMTNIRNLYQSSSSHIRENEKTSISRCQDGDYCSGCSFCDGMEYMENIRKDESIDLADIGEEDGAIFPGEDEVFNVDSDDEQLDFNKADDAATTDHILVEEFETKSFWEHRSELALEIQSRKMQKEHFNSSCRNCFTPTHCSECKTKDFPSAKQNASLIKEFAMRTPLMELGVIVNILHPLVLIYCKYFHAYAEHAMFEIMQIWQGMFKTSTYRPNL